MNLKELRLKSGLKAEYIAQKLEVSRQTYRSYEIGATKPNKYSISILANLFRTNYKYIESIINDSGRD